MTVHAWVMRRRIAIAQGMMLKHVPQAQRDRAPVRAQRSVASHALVPTGGWRDAGLVATGTVRAERAGVGIAAARHRARRGSRRVCWASRAARGLLPGPAERTSPHLESLLQPDAYPHPVERVRLIETPRVVGAAGRGSTHTRSSGRSGIRSWMCARKSSGISLSGRSCGSIGGLRRSCT